ncbi:hypothetical protein EDC04DRAFT_478773 [Pisolithus marmoratus]|nr:hypothetical protein EDC04DRAFT_478773 [Pisolithus marmoratus]
MAIYLALSEQDGKVAAVTRRGLYLVSPDIEFSHLTTERPPRPGVTVSRVTKFEDKHLLSSVSCLQITRTSIYLNWEPSRQDAQPGGGNENNGLPMFLDGLMGHPPMNFPPPAVQPQTGAPGNDDQHPNNHAAAMPNDNENEDEVGTDEANEFFGHPGDLPHLEPATFGVGEYEEEEVDEEEEEEEEEDQVFDDDFVEDFFDPEADPFEHPMHDHGNPVMVHMGAGDPGGMHLLINEWFVPINLSTVYRVSF